MKNEPAFPVKYHPCSSYPGGLTKLEYFADGKLNAFLSSPTFLENLHHIAKSDETIDEMRKDVVWDAIKYAKELIKQLEKEK